MKRFSTFAIAALLVTAVSTTAFADRVAAFPTRLAPTAEASRFEAPLRHLLHDLADRIGREDLLPLEVYINIPAAERSADSLALLAYLNGHLEIATWLYGRAVLAHPTDPALLANLGLGLHELYLANPPKPPLTRAITYEERLLAMAVTVLEHAVTLAPDDPRILNNLGVAHLDRWRFSGRTEDLDRAVTELRLATERAPDDATFFAHYGEALAAAGRTDEAVAAFERARALDPVNGALLTAVAGAPAAAKAAYESTPRECSVDFECAVICGGGLIGGVNRVTCEMAMADAVAECKAGRPYPEGYDCGLELPEHGFMIPGFHSGLSLWTPYGSLDAVMDGAGRVKWRLKVKTPSVGPIGATIGTTGTYDPGTGISVTEVKPGIKLSWKGSGALKEIAGASGISPVSVSIEKAPGGETTIKESIAGIPIHVH